ncbi:MAG: aromatic amino acid transport family protein [Patescibacteria group bacterium]
MNKKYISALATFTGTIIGSGFFALPYVASQSGLLIMLIYFVVVGSTILAAGLLYGQVVTASGDARRLPGYAEMYLGKKTKNVVFFTLTLGLIGTLLSYLIIGGEFLAGLFQPLLGGPLILYAFVYFAFGAFFIFKDARTIARVEIIMMILFFLLVILFMFFGFPHINWENLKVPSKNIFLPFGVLTFSLWGLSVVPELKEMLKGEESKMKGIMIWGVIISAIFYILFILLVLGITGVNTAPQAISGLVGILGEKIILFSYIFGFLATFTSFITLGLVLKKIFWYDYGIPKHFSWFFATFIPLALYLLGMKSFINIIGVTGAFMLGIEGIVIFLICLRAKKACLGKTAYNFWMPTPAKYFYILIFATGVVFEIINLLKKL